MTGNIPQTFFNDLSFLQKFSIASNNFTGNVPNDIFQFPDLIEIYLQSNINLIFNYSSLNLESLLSKSRNDMIFNASNIRIIVRNSSEPSFFNLFKVINFSNFSMRSSVNMFHIEWKNEISSVYALGFDMHGNNITGEYPCYFRSLVKHRIIDISSNSIPASADISCYKNMSLLTLNIFQSSKIYATQKQCYSNYNSWAYFTDYNLYCNYRPTCCPTPSPIPSLPFNIRDSWIVDNVGLVIGLTVVFGICVFLIIYSLYYKRDIRVGKYRWVIGKKKRKKKLHKIPKQMKRKRRKSSVESHSLLFGEI